MARLLFVALAGQGHVIPTLPLVAELVRRGHQLRYACGPELGGSVAAAGARWVPLPGLTPFSPPAQVGPEVVASWFRHFFAALAATYPVLLEHCREHPYDAIVYDATNWPARLVARRLGLPAVRTVPNLAENPGYTGVGDALIAGLEHDPVMTAFAEDVAAFASEHDVELDVAATMDVVEALNLVFVPRAFQPAGDTFDERFLFLGPLRGDRDQHETWSPPPGAPVLYLSLGSIFTHRPDLYRTCPDAFADGPFHVAMTIGGLDPAELGPLPGNVEVRPWFPQLAVLRHASAFLTHAGMNSTMEAISYGVPMLAFPQMPEQVVNADRIVELGIGRRLDPESVTPEGLRRAVDDLTASPDVATSLECLRADARAGGGATAGADAIEQHLREDLSRSRPRLRPGTGPADDHQRTDPMAHVRRFDHIGITVADLAAATAFFVGLGLEVEGTGTVEGEFVETVCAIPGARCEIAMLRPPDGAARLELSSFVTPDHVPGSPAAMANELGLRNVSFEVGDLDAVVEELARDGYGLVGGIGQYEDSVRMAYVRGPEGIIVSLFEQIG